MHETFGSLEEETGSHPVPVEPALTDKQRAVVVHVAELVREQGKKIDEQFADVLHDDDDVASAASG